MQYSQAIPTVSDPIQLVVMVSLDILVQGKACIHTHSYIKALLDSWEE